MFKILALAGGLAGAAVLSQYPAFAQDYLQRLAGQVDALTVVVDDFDRSALEAGLTRSEALAQMGGTAFLVYRAEDMRRTFRRHAVLEGHLDALRAANPLERLAMPHRYGDPETLRAAWSDFEPALPLSTAGAVSAGAGLAMGWAAVAAVWALLRWPFRSLSRRRSAPALRREPVLRRPGI